MKPCSKCHKRKPLSEFYRNVGMKKDGHVNQCKKCVLAVMKKRREEKIEEIRAYDRERGLLPHRKEKVRLYYKRVTATKEGRTRLWAQSKAWIERNRHKRRAHIIVGNAIARGKLAKQPCEQCGNRHNIHAHHDDYEKPLEVRWLCRDCHSAHHRELNEQHRLEPTSLGDLR